MQNSEGLWGYIDPYGELKIDYRYSEAGDFKEGVAVCVKDGSRYIVDKGGSEALLY